MVVGHCSKRQNQKLKSHVRLLNLHTITSGPLCWSVEVPRRAQTPGVGKWSLPSDVCVWQLHSCGRLFATPRTVTCQAPLSMGVSRREYWSGLPFPSPGNLPTPGIQPGSPSLQADSLSSEPPGKPELLTGICQISLPCFLIYNRRPHEDPRPPEERLQRWRGEVRKDY